MVKDRLNLTYAVEGGVLLWNRCKLRLQLLLWPRTTVLWCESSCCSWLIDSHFSANRQLIGAFGGHLRESRYIVPIPTSRWCRPDFGALSPFSWLQLILVFLQALLTKYQLFLRRRDIVKNCSYLPSNLILQDKVIENYVCTLLHTSSDSTTQEIIPKYSVCS